MNLYTNLAVLGGFVFLYSLVSARLDKTPFSGALIYLLFGLVAGPIGLGWLNLNVDADGLGTLAELALALVLFTDAARSDLHVLWRNIRLPRRLLLLGLPLTMVLGFGVGLLVFTELTWVEVALIAVILAPTDAALGKAVVTNPAVPAPIREGLNVESGLNDGLCVPVLFILLALAAEVQGEAVHRVTALQQVGQAIGIGMGVGIGLTLSGGWLIRAFSRKKWITETWYQLPVLSMALVCFSVAQALGGSGFIACFCGGLLFDRLNREHKEKYLLAAEGAGDTLALITWVLFGAVVAGHALEVFSWPIFIYAVLSLTVIRMVPVVLVLTGLQLRMKEKLFIGWFGPRGLASIVFVVIVLNQDLPNSRTIAMVVVTTVILSILGHGTSANALTKRLRDY